MMAYDWFQRRRAERVGLWRVSPVGEAGQGPIVTEHFLVKGSRYFAFFGAGYGAAAVASSCEVPAFAELRR